MNDDEFSRTVSELRSALTRVTTREELALFCGVAADVGSALDRSSLALKTMRSADESLRASIERLAKLANR